MIPESVDCIIVGTGLTNSILAAACSRIGKTVLHLDKNKYYGDQWASFTFLDLIEWVRSKDPEAECLSSIPHELTDKSKLFCIDLCPRLMYSNGAMVDLLVKSNVSRYHEFKNNVKILFLVDDKIHVLPFRRSDVFTSPLLSDLVDKRKLMKFVDLCHKFEPGKSTEETSEIARNHNKPIGEFLDSLGLKPIIKEFIINSIAMVEPSESTGRSCERIKYLMSATERFGRSPFILPLYGCGEFPQSFCRLSAVFGGIYCLDTQIDRVEVNPSETRATDSTSKSRENFTVHFSGDHKVASDMLVLDYQNAISLDLVERAEANQTKSLSRAILITRKSIVEVNDQSLAFLRIPPGEKNPNLVYLMEFNSTAMLCPADTFLVYLWTKSTLERAELDLKPTVDLIFGRNVDTVMWKFYYQQPTDTKTEPKFKADLGLHVTEAPNEDVDYQSCVQEAQRIFSLMFADLEFLPRAPDPEEIIT